MSADVFSGSNEARLYKIDTELSLGNIMYLPDFLYREYLQKVYPYRIVPGASYNSVENTLLYKVQVPNTNQYVTIQVEATIPIKVTMWLSVPSISKKFLDQLSEDLFLMLQLFEEQVRKNTIYMAFIPGEDISMRKESQGFIGKIFSDSMLTVYLILVLFSFALFIIIPLYAPAAFVLISLALALTSGKIVARTSDWNITKKNPEIHLLQYQLAPEEFKEFRKRVGLKIHDMRREIYQATLAVGEPLNCDAAGEVFQRYGITCKPDDFIIKKINLYNLVENAANKFGFSTPKTVVTNTIIPNAAAAGPAPRYGTVLVTTGIMNQLEEDELLSVIGHEMSHLKNHDPFTMFILSNIEFLIRWYIIWPNFIAPLFSIVPFFGWVLFYAYFSFAMTLVYFFGKFLEFRADLDSAKIIGQPKVMAEALRKIAFRRLFPLEKREPEFRGRRRAEWLMMDPHPPAYFRIKRLEEIKEPEKIRHTFWRSLIEKFRGFLSA